MTTLTGISDKKMRYQILGSPLAVGMSELILQHLPLSGQRLAPERLQIATLQFTTACLPCCQCERAFPSVAGGLCQTMMKVELGC